MKYAWLVCILWCGPLLAGFPGQEFNVNARYTVESVELAGDPPNELSNSLRGELKRLVGEKLNPVALDDIGSRIRRELHVRAVTHRVVRGQQAQHVRVVFEVRGQPARFEASVPKLLYSSSAGFTGAVEGAATIGPQSFRFGLVSDGDELVERYAGLRARYEDSQLAGGRVRLGLLFETYHEQWDPSTFAEAGNAGEQLYRSRDNVEPAVTIILARPLSVTVGASFERLQSEVPAARSESSNAVVTTLRYHHRLEGVDANQEWDAGYSLRAATSSLGSDFGYARHRAEVRYTYSWGNQSIVDVMSAGVITGHAPLYESFVLGNSTTLRGWDKSELDPLGGNHMVHNSIEYRYRMLDVFYDSGAVWDTGETAVIRHSLGVGVRRNGLCLALAFPVKSGSIEPIFMVGMNY